MKTISCSFLIVALVLIVAVPSGFSADPKDAPDSATQAESADPLAPIAFLAGGEWVAKLPAQTDGTPVAIRAHFTWAENHHAIRINNAYAVGNRAMPYIDGLYAWHPQKKTIIFTYLDAEGSLYEGTVTRDGKVLVHEFQIIDASGTASQFVARVTPEGRDAWVNEIFTRKDGRLEPMVKVRYERMK